MIKFVFLEHVDMKLNKPDEFILLDHVMKIKYKNKM